MKINRKRLIISILIPLAVGGLSALLTMDSMKTFGALNQPALSPPAILFPIVWTLLYTLMGISFYIVWQSNAPDKEKRKAYIVYALQLAVNFFWSIIFFNLSAYLFAFIWLILLWLLIFIMIYVFYSISQPAAYLQVPYLFWVTFAGYLNLMIYFLN